MDEKGKESRRRCLVMDDSETIRRLLGRILKQEDWGTETAANAELALILFDEGKFDLALMDVELGNGLNGIHTAQIIQARERSLKIVMMSGSPQWEETLRSQGPFLKKPFEHSEIVALLHGWDTLKSAWADVDIKTLTSLSRQCSAIQPDGISPL